ncbi:MAG: hypothetical protein R2857_11640 [Vampirovibrionales bacterium]
MLTFNGIFATGTDQFGHTVNLAIAVNVVEQHGIVGVLVGGQPGHIIVTHGADLVRRGHAIAVKVNDVRVACISKAEELLADVAQVRGLGLQLGGQIKGFVVIAAIAVIL